MIIENAPIPAIYVTDFNNQTIDLLKKYADQPILALIYNNQCLGCVGRAIPLAFEMQQENKTIQVIGIHTNFNQEQITEEEIKRVFTIPELPFPIYLDNDHSVYDQFNASGTPQWILITKQSKLSRSIFGSQEGAQNRLMYALEQIKTNT